MKKALLCILVLIFSKENSFAQLSSTAKSIYDSCNIHNPGNVSYAATNGAQIISTPDSNSFYIQWFPVGATQKHSPCLSNRI